MATRFVHYILAVQELDQSRFSQEERIQFLTGALLPDAAPFQMKKKTHFNTFRWRLGADREQMEEVLAGLPSKMRLGWELHLELDKLWQAICFLPNLYRLPGLTVRYGRKIGKKYYEELSDFDLWVRDNLSQEQREDYAAILVELAESQLPGYDWIDDSRWRSFLGLIREDFSKERKYQGPPFVGAKSFREFYEQGKQSAEALTE